MFYFVWLNLILAIFNILPIPPLDGSHIVFNLLPPRYEVFKETFFRYGSTLLIIIIFLGYAVNLDILPLGKVTSYFYQGLFQLLQINI